MAQINKPDEYFNTITWTGDGTTKDITGVGFQPDWVWAKKRSATGFHALADSVRGGTKNIFTNSSGAEETSATDWILSFASDGFGVNSGGNLNQSSATYAAWNWLADNTSGSSNTDGDITSTVSVNQTSGFSIVKWNTGGQPSSTTVSIGHGLNAVPKFFIVKNLPSVEDWFVYHNSLGNTKSILLNSTNAEFTNSDIWGSTTPTSSVFSINTAEWGVSTNDKITYCFAEKKGFSKFGSYTGNGSTDGTFVYTGFKPAFVIVKGISGALNWTMVDNKRDPFNDNSTNYLHPNTSGDEGVGLNFDFLSNGFKLRSNSSPTNGSGVSYIYMAFAEQPLVGTNNIPATAR
jgi:hypothetical protein